MVQMSKLVIILKLVQILSAHCLKDMEEEHCEMCLLNFDQPTQITNCDNYNCILNSVSSEVQKRLPLHRYSLNRYSISINSEAYKMGIQMTEPIMFNYDENLLGLCMQNNKIQDLSGQTFQFLYNLRVLDLNNNCFKNVKNNVAITFRKSNLEELHESMIESLFNNTSEITFLNIGNYLLAKLGEDSLENRNKLQVLDLLNNEIHRELFGNTIIALIYFDLLDIKLKNLNYCVFDSLALAKVVNIWNNLFLNKSLTVFHDLHELSTNLFIGKNSFTSNYLDHLSLLQNICLYDNSWNCEFLARLVKKLKSKSVYIPCGTNCNCKFSGHKNNGSSNYPNSLLNKSTSIFEYLNGSSPKEYYKKLGTLIYFIVIVSYLFVILVCVLLYFYERNNDLPDFFYDSS